MLEPTATTTNKRGLPGKKSRHLNSTKHLIKLVNYKRKFDHDGRKKGAGCKKRRGIKLTHNRTLYHLL